MGNTNSNKQFNENASIENNMSKNNNINNNEFDKNHLNQNPNETNSFNNNNNPNNVNEQETILNINSNRNSNINFNKNSNLKLSKKSSSCKKPNESSKLLYSNEKLTDCENCDNDLEATKLISERTNNNNEKDFGSLNKFQIKNENQNKNLHINSNLNPNQLTLDSIIVEAGYNSTTFKIYFLTILKTIMHAFYSTYLVFIIEPFQKNFNLTNTKLEFILSLHYIGFGLGSLCSGALSKRFTRLGLLHACYSFILLFHCLICISSRNIVVFGCSRFSISMCIGILNIIQTNILSEFLPVKLRSFMLNSIWCFYPMGIVCYLEFKKFYYKKSFYFYAEVKNVSDLERDYLAPFKAYILALVLAAASHFAFCEDSPRSLLLTGQLDKAKLILEKISAKKFSDDEIILLQFNLKNTGENKFYVNKPGFRQIFSKRILGFSLLMSLLYLSLNFAFSGLSSIYPSIMKQLFEEKQTLNISPLLANSNFSNLLKKKETVATEENYYNVINSFTYAKNNSIENLNYINAINNEQKKFNLKIANESTSEIIKYNLIGFITLLTGAAYSEFKITSKKFTKIFLLLASIIFSFLAIFKHEKFYVFISLSNHLCELCVVMVETYACEIYPTVIKDYAIGFLEFAEGVGGVFSQFGFISIYTYGKFFPVYLFALCVFVSVLILLKLPNDNEKSLDSVIFEEKAEEGEKLKENNDKNIDKDDVIGNEVDLDRKRNSYWK